MIPIPLSDCTFGAEADNNGCFIGRCREFPEVRTRPYKSRLDAIDSVMQLVSEKIRHRDAATSITRRDADSWVG